jgi:transposase
LLLIRGILAALRQKFHLSACPILADHLFAKRLEKGRFVWPQAKEGAVSLTPAQLSMLLEGIDWRMPARTWRPELAS